MDSELIAALISAVAVISAALISIFRDQIRNWKGSPGKLDQIASGTIDEPRSGSHVKRTFDCSGKIHGYRRGESLWLAVEKSGRFWPKEGRVIPHAKTGKWTATVFEDGRQEQFDLSLYVVTRSADAQIEEWLETGRNTDSYPGLLSTKGMRRLARVEQLALK